MLRCRINGTRYDIAEGAVFSELANETLDSGTIIIPQITWKPEAEPYDAVEIWSEGDGPAIEPRTMLIDSINLEETSLEPAIYKATITLFSCTKALEGILLPSVSTTPLATGTKRSVLHYLQQYLEEYGPKTSYDEKTLKGTPKWSLSEDVIGRFDSVECPELQWNEPTLREVLNDLMMVDDCVATMSGNVIDCMYLGSDRGEITDGQRKCLNYVSESRSSEDYVSELKMTARNAVGSEPTSLIEEIGFRNNDTYQLTTERLQLETQLPIWRVLSCTLINRVWGSVTCKKDSYSELSVSSWYITDGTTQMSVDSDGIRTFSPVSATTTQQVQIHVEGLGKTTSRTYKYKIVAKCLSKTSGVQFQTANTEGSGTTYLDAFKLYLTTSYQTFEGTFTGGSGIYRLIMLPAVDSGGTETIYIKEFHVYGTEAGTYTYTLPQSNLAKIEKDIAPYIVEYGKWQTLDVYYQGYGDEMPMSTSYQNTCLYFKRGSKGIFNFSAMQTYKTLWIENQTLVYQLMIKDAESRGAAYLLELAKKTYPTSDGYYGYETSATVPTNPGACRFRMEYEPIGDVPFLASKFPLQRNKRQVVDNQSSSYVDIGRLGDLEYQKARRLGNRIKLANGRYVVDESSMPRLFQKIGGSVIYKKEIAVYSNYIIANYQATENYVLKDYFTSVKSKLRSWRIVDGSEAFTRSDILKFHAGANVKGISNSNAIIPSYSTAQEYLDKFKYCVVQFTASDGSTLPANPDYNYYYSFGVLSVPVMVTKYRIMNALMVETSKRVAGKSVIFTFSMLDNTLAGKYVYSNYEYKDAVGWVATLLGFDANVGGQQRSVRYTDGNGEITGGVIRFFSKMHAPDLFQTDPCFSPSMRPLVSLNGVHTGNYQYDGNFEDSDGLVAKIPFTLHKDNKEILQLSVQFEISDEANDMLLGKK